MNCQFSHIWSKGRPYLLLLSPPPPLPPSLSHPTPPTQPPLPVEFLRSHETAAQCCDSSFSVRVARLVVSVLISTLTSHAGLESYQSPSHLPSRRAQHTCDTCLTLHVGGAELRTLSCSAASWNLACNRVLWSLVNIQSNDDARINAGRPPRRGEESVDGWSRQDSEQADSLLRS